MINILIRFSVDMLKEIKSKVKESEEEAWPCYKEPIGLHEREAAPVES